LVENHKILNPTCSYRPRRGDPVEISRRCLILIQLTGLLCDEKNNDNMLGCFHRLPELDGRTAGRTDGQNCYINIMLYQYDVRQKLAEK